MSSRDSKWNEETKSGTYSDKIHHGEMKRGWENNPVLSGKPKAMTVAELLKPRYKVIAEDTSGDFTIGQILVQEEPNDLFFTNLFGFDIAHDRIKEYPHLFKKLEWWEDREEKDMPEHVKCIKTPDQRIMPGHVFRVDEWFSKNCARDRGNILVMSTNCYLPATEEEYNQYLTSVQLK